MLWIYFLYSNKVTGIWFYFYKITLNALEKSKKTFKAVSFEWMLEILSFEVRLSFPCTLNWIM